MKKGFYWVKFPEDKKYTCGYFTGNDYYGWSIIGSDDVFKTEELIVGGRIK